MFTKGEAGYIDAWEDYHDQMVTGRACSNCKYLSVYQTEMPCRVCTRRSRWEGVGKVNVRKARRAKRSNSNNNPRA